MKVKLKAFLILALERGVSVRYMLQLFHPQLARRLSGP